MTNQVNRMAVTIVTSMTMAMAMSVCSAKPMHAEEQMPADVAAYLESNRRSLTLLEKGEFQATLSFSAAMSGSQLDFGSSSTTEFMASTTLSYGISKRVEVFAQLPYALTTQREDFLGTATEATTRQIAAALGVRAVLGFETEALPEFVGSLAISAPLGHGHAVDPSLRIGLAAFKSFDPIIVNAGVGFTVGQGGGPTRMDLSAGLDFAVNDQVSLGTDVGWSSDGSNFADALHDGVSLTMRAGLSSADGTSTLSPFVTIGATRGAPDATIGLSWSRKW